MHLNLSILPSGLSRKFQRVFRENLFQGFHSRSGNGSDLSQTKEIQAELPAILGRYGIESMLDVPCGDLHWMSKIAFSDVHYTGADIVDELIKELNASKENLGKSFILLDITKTAPGTYDAIFCRDLFVHLNTRQVISAIRNIKKSNSKYLITTTFTGNRAYKNLPLVSRRIAWRPINLQLKPFHFPEPDFILNENCTEGDGLFSDKSLGIWEVKKLPNF